MFGAIVRKIFGTRNEREIKGMQPLIDEINCIEPRMAVLSDRELRGLTDKFRKRLEEGETLDDLLPEAFAAVREASKRVLGMRHFDVQLIGGIVLHRGKIAEMKTGEGKTLVAPLAVYLNALSGKGVHVVTVNDYLASRDAEWMGRVYRFMGLSVGVILHGLDDDERKAAYGADVTYGTNNEFGFDYLRDNMKYHLEQYVQRELNYAIVDEVDSILIDEARTPLIISGPSDESTALYGQINTIIPRLKKDEDYEVDEKARTAVLSDEGVQHVEKLLGVENLYDPNQIEILHHVTQALKAHALFKRDVDYVVKEGESGREEVIIVDEFTGRLMPGRRYSDGLHQALEAKEGVRIESENQTLASITFQNYFRMYDKLSGMTGTADTEAAEFNKIYSLEVMVIPTNMPMIRDDQPDVIYRTEKEKFAAIVESIKEKHQRGQPVLVGTVSIENSEKLASYLKRRGVKHHVLNAKHHEKEAEIVAQAGRKGAVTISTNMAGRGTDIVLGGNPEFMVRARLKEDASEEERNKALAEMRTQCLAEREEVLAAGGLHILGTERHESRRIDNQLRGRSGRQGDPGSSKFYLSLEDYLLRIFGSERIQGIMGRLGMEEGQPIEHRFISKAIENAQRKVEAHNFDIRKHLLEYDDVMNRQREVIYKMRRQILGGLLGAGDEPSEIEKRIEETIEEHAMDGAGPGAWDLAAFSKTLSERVELEVEYKKGDVAHLGSEEFREKVRRDVLEVLELRPLVDNMIEELAEAAVFDHAEEKGYAEDWDLEGLNLSVKEISGETVNYAAEDMRDYRFDDLADRVISDLRSRYREKERAIGPKVMRQAERFFWLQTMDYLWKEHLVSMDHLKEGIGLRGYGQKDPLQEYKREGFELFQGMVETIQRDVLKKLFRVQIQEQEETPREIDIERLEKKRRMVISRGEGQKNRTVKRSEPKVGRNDPCPCGSGKKYKKCHGRS